MTYNEILGVFKKYMPEGVQDKVIVPIPVEDGEQPEPQENVIELGDVTVTEEYGTFHTQNCKILKSEYPYEQYTSSNSELFRVDGIGEYLDENAYMDGCAINTDLEEYQDYCYFAIEFEILDETSVPVGEHLVEIKCNMTPTGESEPVEVILRGTFNFPEIQ